MHTFPNLLHREFNHKLNTVILCCCALSGKVTNVIMRRVLTNTGKNEASVSFSIPNKQLNHFQLGLLNIRLFFRRNSLTLVRTAFLDHTQRHNKVGKGSSGRGIGLSQKCVPIRDSQDTNIHARPLDLFLYSLVLCLYFIRTCFILLIVMHFAFCLYLQHKQPCPPVGFEPATPGSDWPQNFTLDRSAPDSV